MSPAPGTRVRFGEFDVDLEGFAIYRAGSVVPVQRQPFDVLAALLAQPGRIVTRNELRERIWQADTFVDFDHSLNIAINKLRAALDDSAEHPRFIETVPRRGYRFIGRLDAGDAIPAAAASPVTDAFRLRHRRTAAAALVVTIALASAAAAWSISRRAPGGRSPAPSRIDSIAVLPISDLSADAEAHTYFADSLTDELITSLAQLPGVRVVSRTSILTFRDRADRPIAEIAAALGVNGVVQGTVLRSGSRVRVTAQLIDAAADRHVWAQSYEGDVRDVLSLQREVAAEIARSIGRQVEGEMAAGIRVKDAAVDEYLRGRYAWNVRTDASIHEAIEHFVRATELEPDYGPAFAGLADCYATLGYLSNILPADGFSGARAAAERAIELDGSLAEAHASLAYVHLYYDWDWRAAEREFRTALSFNPNLAIAHQWYAVYLTAMLRPGEARREIELARGLDPLSSAIATDVGFQLYYTRQYDAAARHLRALTDLNPKFALSHLWLGRTFQQQHRFDEARQEYALVERALPDWPVAIAASASVEGWAGRRDDVRRELKRLRELSQHRYVTPYAFALAYAALDEREEALSWLKRGVDDRTPWMVWLKLDPRWGTLATDPRFVHIVGEVGLP